ncbi:hypothetical protein [Caballeronia sp. TF1N1]|uniref:hypothetical protein n=1 Tax=Caballeronia sp. TF1N1 TaxID=2878153 RepID=UPI001FD1E890|nr:hypothetical protein [Caballeronia sp. TF1N1]
MKATVQNGKRFHFLVAAEITFVVLDEKNQPLGDPTFARVNGRITAKEDRIGVAQLSRANTEVQMVLKSKMGDEAFAQIQIIDVVFQNFMLLGFMTEEEFQKRPLASKKTALELIKSAEATLQ